MTWMLDVGPRFASRFCLVLTMTPSFFIFAFHSYPHSIFYVFRSLVELFSIITSTSHTFNPSPIFMYFYLISTYSALLLTPQGVMYMTRRMHSKFSYTHLLVLSLRLQLGLCVVIFLHLALALLAGVSPVYLLSKPLSLLTSVSRSGLLPLQHIFCFIWPTLYFVRI